MVQDTADQTWQQMYKRIEQLLPRFLNGELQMIEYNPRNVIALLEMPSGYGNENHGQQSKLTNP
jgi:hypothetical protein